MKRYFVIEITTTADGTAKAIHEKESEAAARMVYHQIKASAYANDKVTFALCQIVDENGFAIVTSKK